MTRFIAEFVGLAAAFDCGLFRAWRVLRVDLQAEIGLCIRRARLLKTALSVHPGLQALVSLWPVWLEVSGPALVVTYQLAPA